MSTSLEVKFPPNLRMYNMFPFRRYTSEIGIDGMHAYIQEVAAMGYNAIWVNPLNATGTKVHLHASGHEVSGSLYAMTDDKTFNPLIFPSCETVEECELKLKQWTAEVRLNGMFPLFDLVLNHIGINEEGDGPLELKFKKLGLLLQKEPEGESEVRWPDVCGLDYYKTGSKKRGLNCEPEQLDHDKIDKIFKELWEPFITRYIVDYGFMGVRADALTHVPVAIQQRAYQLIQKLVKEHYNVDALIVGEFMVGNPDEYLDSLSTCGLTHCLQPCSFYWGHNMDGGYGNGEASAFISQNHKFPEIVLAPRVEMSDFKSVKILSNATFIKEKHTENNAIYITQGEEGLIVTVTGKDYQRKFSPSLVQVPLSYFENYKELEEMIETYDKARGPEKGEALKTAKAFLLKQPELKPLIQRTKSQKNLGGLIGVVGNHDVGTLKAKIMLDLAYCRALDRAKGDEELIKEVDNIHDQFKQGIIKGIKSTDELMGELERQFKLENWEVKQLFKDINFRMREKIFIQAMMCSGGWYSLAGDELGVCHKPEVFSEFAKDSDRVGSSLIDRASSPYRQHDLRAFIGGINSLLQELPSPSLDDKKSSLYYEVLNPKLTQFEAWEFMFSVIRHSAAENKFFLLVHCTTSMSEELLVTLMEGKLKFENQFDLVKDNCDIYCIDPMGNTQKIEHPFKKIEILLEAEDEISHAEEASSTSESTEVGEKEKLPGKTLTQSSLLAKLGLLAYEPGKAPVEVNKNPLKISSGAA